MKIRPISAAIVLALGGLFAHWLGASEPIIPPTISKVWPAGMERGTTATFTVDGRNLADAKAVLFDSPGITARVTEITDVPEKITGPRAGVDLGAQVPLGKKQTARIEVTVGKNVAPGIHKFRIETPLGTSDMAVFDVGSLPEIAETPRPEAGESPAQAVTLPATIVGAIQTSGDTDKYQFDGRAGEEFVSVVVASELGSPLQSLLILQDSSGQVLARAGENSNKADAVLIAKLPRDGSYILSVADREDGGGADHFYRLNAGPLPYITGVFPLGVRAGEARPVAVQGVNLGGARQVKVTPPAAADGWTTVPLVLSTQGTEMAQPLNTVKLAVGNEPEILDREPNNSPAQAQALSLPVTVNGHIQGNAGPGAAPDQDYFRFHARQGERLTIEVAASRLGSPLDSVIEVLDAQGNPIPRAMVRCLNQTTTTLSDRDSRTSGVRLVSTSGLHEGDFLMIGDELDQISSVPDQPDADINLENIGGLRLAFLGTSPDVHAVNTPVYKAQVLPPDADFPPNGLPVFRLTWRNDDGGPGYGADSRLDFVAPRDADYIVRLADVRNLEGADFAYRLTVRDTAPDYQLAAEPSNPNVPRGGSVPVTVRADRLPGYEGPIAIEVRGLPHGLTAGAATIAAGQDSTDVILSAAGDAPEGASPAAIEFVGRARVDGREIVRVANTDTPLQVASVIPPPDVLVTAEPGQVAIAPGQEVKVTLHVERRNGFKGRVPCSVENLPPGVRVVNVGLNGVLVTEAQTTRTFTLRAEEWAKPIDQPAYVVGEVESNASTFHPSAPLLVRVENKEQAANAAAEAAGHGAAPAVGQPPRN
ncbi:MAG TPA: hypothetical protein VG860_07400 [Terriglobia bacterium]|jgi:hypothetical protein|nr:hypothetical protein [Terriglobia bacterium]